ncbi:MAG: hypothetical protein ACE5KE_14155 [Methanosarcinales archaeon]
MLSEENQISNILRKLNREGIPYLIIGGVPTILYGVERPTYDIDIAVPEDLEVLTEIMDILRGLEYNSIHRCPFPHDFLMPIDFITAQFIIDKGCVEFRNEELELFPVDILAVGMDLFQELSEEAITIPFKNTFMLCPSIQKLIEMKETVGRPEDIEDVRKLRQILGKLEKKYYE